MAKKRYYAWTAPGGSGICETWDECRAAISGYRHVKHQGFATYEEAWHFAYPGIPMPSDNPLILDEPMLTANGRNGTAMPADNHTALISSDFAISPSVNDFCLKHDFNHLSDRQKMAVQSIDGKTLLFAVPGSGKTTVIIARTGYMVYSRKIDPKSIISLTFTKAAANEMLTRFKDRFKTDLSPDFRTIHSLCYSIILPMLRRSGFSYPSHLLGAEDKDEGKAEGEKRLTPTHIYRMLFKRLYCNIHDFETAMETAQCIITGIKNSIMYPRDYENKTIKLEGTEILVSQLFQDYRQLLEEYDCMDYDDLLIHTYKGLKSYPDVLKKLQSRYLYWNVDEAQDTSRLQFMLLELLYGEHGNVFMVGDDDQSIYSFRGSNPRLLLQFGHRADVTPLLMGYNYRSDRNIVLAAREFIAKNRNRENKEMQAFSSLPGCIHIPQAFHNERGQYDYIAKAAKEAVAKQETIAVLYRRNISCLPLIVYLHRNSIPYESAKGLADILNSKIVKVIWRAFQFIITPHSFKAFSACKSYLGVPSLSDKELEDIKLTHKNSKSTPILEIIYQKYLENDNPEEAGEIKDLIQLISQIEEMKPSEAAVRIISDLYYCYPESIGDRLRVYSFLSASDLYSTIPEFMSDIQTILSEERKKTEDSDPTDFDSSLATVATASRPFVTLSSMHASKGREFDRVIIIDTFDEIMPGKARDDALIYDPEEELRLFYVAVTRAAHRLDLLTVANYHGNMEIASRFVSDFAFICDQHYDNSIVYDSLPEENTSLSGEYHIEPQKFYAVKAGRKPGIYLTWTECQAQISGFSGAEHKSFTSREEAEDYLGITAPPPKESLHLGMIEKQMIGSGSGSINYPMDIPSAVCNAIHRLFGVSSIDQLDSASINKLRQQSSYMFAIGKIANYHHAAAAYMLLYLPVNYYKIWKPLHDLALNNALPEACSVLELGAGPGTATMGLISFYSEMAKANRQHSFSLDITAVEREESFLPIFDSLTGSLRNSCPSNLNITITVVNEDALKDLPVYSRQYDLLIESNMLNAAEGVSSHSIKSYTKVLQTATRTGSRIIVIEPGQKDNLKLLQGLSESLSSDGVVNCLSEPTLKTVNTEQISLYQEAVKAGLRSKTGKAVHWFSYLVMERR